MDTDTPKRRGGARPGAGRPRSQDPTGVYRVRLTQSQAQAAQVAGDGEISRGVRAIVQQWMDDAPDDI